MTDKRNTAWTLVIAAPLLRPGMTLTVGPVSEGYIVEETQKALEKVREINAWPQKEARDD